MVYWHYFCIHLKSQMQYKVSFVLTALGQFLGSFTAFLGIWFMFTRFHQVDGFTFEERFCLPFRLRNASFAGSIFFRK